MRDLPRFVALSMLAACGSSHRALEADAGSGAPAEAPEVRAAAEAPALPPEVSDVDGRDGEDCGSFFPLEIGVDELGTTADANDDVTSAPCPCGERLGGNDRVYAFRAPADGTVALWVGEVDLCASHAVYVRTACDDAESQIGCGRYGSASTWVPVSAGETYYVIVEGPSVDPAFAYPNSDVFVLRSEVLPAVPGDQCADAIEAEIGVDQHGDLTPATDDATGACLGHCWGGYDESGADVFYAFTPETDGTLWLTVEGAIDAAVYVLDDCADAGREATCDDNTYSPLGVRVRAGETVLAVVDGLDSHDRGAFTLSSELRPTPAGDACDDAVALEIGVGVPGDTTDAAVDSSGSCVGYGTQDLVYSVVAPADGTMPITLSSEHGLGMYVRADCDDFDSESVCTQGTYDGSDDVLYVPVRASETYFVHVDGRYEETDAFEIRADPPFPTVAGDGCPDAIAFAIGADVEGDTTGAVDDHEGEIHWAAGESWPCAGRLGGDVVYVATPEVDGTLSLSVDADWWAGLYVRSDCEDADTELACTDAVPPALDVEVTAGEPVYVFVDSDRSSETGPFTLSSAFTPR